MIRDDTLVPSRFAEQIDKLKISGRTFALTVGPGSPADNFLDRLPDDVHLLEVS